MDKVIHNLKILYDTKTVLFKVEKGHLNCQFSYFSDFCVSQGRHTRYQCRKVIVCSITSRTHQERQKLMRLKTQFGYSISDLSRGGFKK